MDVKQDAEASLIAPYNSVGMSMQKTSWRNDVNSVRALRLALTTTAAVAIAYTIDWPLSFITTIFVWGFLNTPNPRQTLREGVGNIIYIFLGTGLGVLLTLSLLNMPVVVLLVLLLLMLMIFYANNSGAPPFFVIWLLIGITLIPMMGFTSQALAIEIAKNITFGGIVAVCLVWLAYGLLPNPPGADEKLKAAVSPLPSPDERLRAAILSTMVSYPVVLLFFVFNISGAVIIMIFIAILSQQTNLGVGKKMGSALIMGNIFGGITAMFIYELLVMVPQFEFLLLLMFAGSLLFATANYSERPAAPLYGMAFSTVLLLIGTGTMPYGDEVDTKFVLRILQISIAVLYIVGAFKLLERLSRSPQQSQKESPKSTQREADNVVIDT
jgi:uncharacterized membrane protein YccC